MNLRGVLLHIMGDALGSVVVIIGALVFLFCEGSWVLRVDPLLRFIKHYNECCTFLASFVVINLFKYLQQSHGSNYSFYHLPLM